ncbi:hypothetical protein G6011_04016 [Alternaria panax]|uniref:Uncharacterized protein n=1 Tax=Alternaria panax TaxID=48097 RepID=A0AAD4IGJ1_9PLEO|nr:hypothetical protein G6011_04016 [Alternaria panax]
MQLAMQTTEYLRPHMPPNSERERPPRPAGYTTTAYSPPCATVCDICKTQYRPCDDQHFDEFTYTNSINDKEAQALLSAYKIQMKKDQEHMKANLQRYGGTL